MLKILFNGKEVPIVLKTFSGGEEHVQIQHKDVPTDTTVINRVDIHARIRNSSDLVRVLMLHDAASNLYHGRGLQCEYTLSLSYIPYARQDRICNVGESFTLRVFARLINDLKLKYVYVDDPHSDVSSALINNCVARPQGDIILELCKTNSELKTFLEGATLVSPDAGSNKKIIDVCKTLNKDNFVRADKIRDVATNKIIETVVMADTLSGDYLIVDDICDGGRTFIALADILRKKGASRVGLYVSHGIFLNGKDYLLDNGIDFIFTHNDWTQTGE